MKKFKSKKIPRFNPMQAIPLTGVTPEFIESQAEPFTEEEKSIGRSKALKIVGDTLAPLDIPASVGRSGINEIVQGNQPFSAMGEQISNIYEDPINAPSQAPTGTDILESSGIFEKDEDSFAKDASGFIAEMLTDPTTYINPLKPIGKLASKGFRKAATKKLARHTERAISRINNISKSMLDSGFDSKTIANTMVEEDLVKYIRKPNKLLDVISGTRDIEKITTSAGNIIKRGNRKGGLISKASETMKDLVSQVSEEIPHIQKNYISNSIMLDYADKLDDIVDATGLTVSDIESKIPKIVNKYLKSDNYSLNELFQLKKNLSKELSSKLYFQPADKAIAFDKRVMMSVQRKIDDTIKSALEPFNINGVEAKDLYDVQNNRLHNYINLSGFLENVPTKELKDADLGAMLASMGAKGTAWGMAGMAAEALGSPSGSAIASGLAGMGIEAGAKGAYAVKENFPAVMAKGLDMTTKAPEAATRLAPQAGREINRGRSPDSLIGPRERLEVNLSKDLIKAKLPRTSDYIKQNKDLFKLKAAQNAENVVRRRMVSSGMMPDEIDPNDVQEAARNMFEQLKVVLEDNADIDAVFPLWVQEMPELFEKDRYNRLNGQVPESMKPLVRDDIRKNRKISNIERVNQLSELNRSGRYTWDLDTKGGM